MPRQCIIAFGYHDQESPRHWSVCSALQREGWEIVECHTEVRGLVGKYRDLWKKYREVVGVRCPVSGVLVTFPGHYLVPLAWILIRLRPKGYGGQARPRLLFDAFVSLYDTNVCDRGRAPLWHPRAWLWYLMDFLSCHLADEVIIDTEEHKKYFARVFRLRPERIRVVYLEARPDLFFPQAPHSPLPTLPSFEVLFYGTYIPLHGIEHIIDAAHTLQERAPHVHFTIVGHGQTAAAARDRAQRYGLRNITFRGAVPYSALPHFIRAADLCLGIFGTTPKAQRVIPHKVYDAVACGIPIVTADSPALRERFAHHPLVTLCPPGNPQSIVDAILRHATARGKALHPANTKTTPSLIG